eukprot:370548-Pyramimonas_sp.AAC.3
MKFTVYLPPAATSGKVPVSERHLFRAVDTLAGTSGKGHRRRGLKYNVYICVYIVYSRSEQCCGWAQWMRVVYYLSGLTCTDENVIQKNIPRATSPLFPLKELVHDVPLERDYINGTDQLY